ncbi:MAG: DNA-binding protein [Stenotrophomonas sp.]|nr:DNA-binding protein [Stenotrophomonas sp.]
MVERGQDIAAGQGARGGGDQRIHAGRLPVRAPACTRPAPGDRRRWPRRPAGFGAPHQRQA